MLYVGKQSELLHLLVGGTPSKQIRINHLLPLFSCYFPTRLPSQSFAFMSACPWDSRRKNSFRNQSIGCRFLPLLLLRTLTWGSTTRKSSGRVFVIVKMFKMMSCKWGGVRLKVSSLDLNLNVQLRVKAKVIFTVKTAPFHLNFFLRADLIFNLDIPGWHVNCSAASCCNGTRNSCFTCSLSQRNVLLVFLPAGLFQICHLWCATNGTQWTFSV